MKKTFTASLLAFSIAITSITAVPAQASSDEDIAKFLAGAAALFILGKAIENNKAPKKQKKKKRKVKPKKTYQQQPHVSRNQHRRHRIRKSPMHHVVPAECGFPIKTRRGNYREVFGEHCLEKNMRLARLLPAACEENVRIRHGRRADVYDGRCLRKFGYRVEARRF